jgi:hypothetical protein
MATSHTFVLTFPLTAVIDGRSHKLQAITSVVASGTYMADADGHTHDEVLVSTVYTGKGFVGG